ncbi:cyclopropane-fatty-acyl-phospholipid synthase [Meredithblackwellia eburnea MCA 4105]
MSSSYFATPNYREASKGKLVDIADKAIHGLKEAFVSKSWGPMVVLAQTAIVALMEKIERGQLRLVSSDGKLYTFGTPAIYSEKYPNPNKTAGPSPADEITVELVVVNDAFWVRMLLLSDLGFAEAYMAGDIEVDNLENIFKLFILNRASLGELSTGVAGTLYSAFNAIINTKFVNSLSNSISNISAHYDISNRMFESFLSPDMTYSCAIFGEEEGGLEGDLKLAPRKTPPTPGVDELQAAQMRKIREVIAKAKITKGDKVLEIGSGWGSFAIEAVRTTGCTVDTLTLSIEQKMLAEERISEAGLSSFIKVHLLDYRSLPGTFTGAFDRVISIEMIEAVGKEFLPTYFATVDKVLKPERGLAVVQVITMPEARFESYGKSVDFIQKWIFPGGFLPSVTCLVDAILAGSKGRLLVEQIDNIGPHYARTLREWRRRFEATFDTDIVPALRQAYPELKGRKGVDVFRRKWIYYFAYCASGFSTRALGDHILTITREGNLSLNQ